MKYALSTVAIVGLLLSAQVWAQDAAIPQQPGAPETMTYQTQVLQQLVQINNTLKNLLSAELARPAASPAAPLDTKSVCIFFDHAYSEGSETNGLVCTRSDGRNSPLHWTSQSR